MTRKARTVEEEWRDILLGTDPMLRSGRRFFAKIPSPPRCELCAVPFGGPFAPVLRLFGKGPFPRNPRYCIGCCAHLMRIKGGVEIPLSFLFVDVRGSTPLGERLGPKGLHDLMDRFYQVGTASLIKHDALIDRFMGDQVVGYFVPGFAGPKHARKAIECALDILRATGHANDAPWVPVGAGVHTGNAFVGAVGKAGEGDMVEFTAIGDSVNIAARLASVAQTGDLVVSEEAFNAADAREDAEQREPTLKGVSTPVKVRVLRIDSTP